MDGYPEGSNLTIMNAMYEKPHRDEDGNYVPDYLHIVFKDNETGLKHVQTIKEPTYTYYMAKDGVPITHNMEWIEASKVRPVTCPYNKIKESIARETGNLALFKENMRSGNYRLNDNFFAHPRVFSADMNILNYCRMEFANTYQNPVCPITVAYYDIENDIIDAVSDEPVIGDSPINIASIYFDATKTVYCFILRNGRNPQIAEFEEDITKHFKKYKDMVNNFIEENIGSRAKTEKYKLNDLELSVGFFDTERELIQTFFSVMKKLSPDFAVAYNSSYDLPYLLARGELFGLNPIDLISDDCFSRKFYYYFIDHDCYNDYEERKDYVMASSLTTWLDQLIIYPSRRKGQNAISSFTLDNVCSHECGVRKLDWHHITNQFKYFAYKNFILFWLYNINDTIVQACLEAQTEDLRYVFNNVIEMNTPYQKIFRQTNYLSSKGMEFYKHHEGVIMGNNINRFGTKPTEKFPGAFVAKPTKLTDRNKVRCNGYPIMKFANADDFDYKALYPSLMREFNMSVSTQVGKILIEKPPFEPIEYLRLGAGGHFSEDIASYNFIQFAHRWMQFPDVEEMLDLVDKYFETMRTPHYIMAKRNNMGARPMDLSHKSVMGFVDRSKPLIMKPKMPDWVRAETDKIRERIKVG